MRNWTWGLIAIVMLGGWFVYVGVLKFDEVTKKETVYGDLLLFFMMMFFACMYGKELMYKYSSHASGYGDHTSLMNIVPIGQTTVKNTIRTIVKDENDPTKEEIKWVSQDVNYIALARGGNSILGMRGGGSHGYIVAREELLLSMPGDPSNLIIYGVPEPYKMDQAPGSKYKDFTALHPKIRSMAARLNGFTDRSVIMLYDLPVSPDPRRKIPYVEYLNYKGLYEDANTTIFGKDKTIDDQNKVISKMGSAVKKISSSFGNERDGFIERNRPRKREEYDEDDGRN